MARDTTASIARELGRLTEAMEQGKADRDELKSAVEKLSGHVEALRLAMAGLTQSMQSTTHQVVSLGLEKAGDRLGRIEVTIARWQRLIGEGIGFVLKAVTALLAAGVIGGGVGAWLSRVAQHL